MSVAPQLRASIFDEYIDKLQAEKVELSARLANSSAELEALWNKTNQNQRYCSR